MFEVGDPVETTANPKGYGIIVNFVGAPGLSANVGVRLAGRTGALAFHIADLRPCKCKTRILKRVSRCQA